MRIIITKCGKPQFSVLSLAFHLPVENASRWRHSRIEAVLQYKRFRFTEAEGSVSILYRSSFLTWKRETWISSFALKIVNLFYTLTTNCTCLYCSLLLRMRGRGRRELVWNLSSFSQGLDIWAVRAAGVCKLETLLSSPYWLHSHAGCCEFQLFFFFFNA